jgi:hypothetical protein
LKTIENKEFKEEIVVGLVKEKREIWKRGSGRNLYHSLQEAMLKHSIKIGRDGL